MPGATDCTPLRGRKRYTGDVKYRFVAFLIMLAIGLQGPSLAYAAAVTAKTAPASCAGHMLGQGSQDDSSCCMQGIAPGLCCAGGVALSGPPGVLAARLAIRARLLPVASASAAFATERPAPLLRPPIR